jgi:hypothetical protein
VAPIAQQSPRNVKYPSCSAALNEKSGRSSLLVDAA